jgi:hypothetical protein
MFGELKPRRIIILIYIIENPLYLDVLKDRSFMAKASNPQCQGHKILSSRTGTGLQDYIPA